MSWQKPGLPLWRLAGPARGDVRLQRANDKGFPAAMGDPAGSSLPPWLPLFLADRLPVCGASVTGAADGLERRSRGRETTPGLRVYMTWSGRESSAYRARAVAGRTFPPYRGSAVREVKGERVDAMFYAFVLLGLARECRKPVSFDVCRAARASSLHRARVAVHPVALRRLGDAR